MVCLWLTSALVSPIKRTEFTKFIVAFLFCCVAATFFFPFEFLIQRQPSLVSVWWYFRHCSSTFYSDSVTSSKVMPVKELSSKTLRLSERKSHLQPHRLSFLSNSSLVQNAPPLFFFQCNWTYLMHIKDISVHIFGHRSERLSEKNVFLIGALLTRGNYRRLGVVQRDGNGRWLGTRRHYCGGFGGGKECFHF